MCFFCNNSLLFYCDYAADLPGCDDVDVSMDGNAVTIKAERKSKHELSKDTAHLFERCYGKVFRTFTIPDTGNSIIFM